MNKTQKGFGHLLILAMVVLVVAVSGVSYFVWQKNKPSPKPAASTGAGANMTAASTIDTSTWKSYSSVEGQFSLKYSDNWVTADNPAGCTPGIALFGPDKHSVGTCGSENFGQISVVSSEGNSVDSEDLSTDPGFNHAQISAITVDGVTGKRIQVVAGSDPGGEGDFSFQAGSGAYPVGTTVVRYLFSANNRTYEATYVHKPSGTKDVMADFDTMISKTLKFQAS